MPSEVFPHKVRAKAVSLSTASNWAWNCGLAFAVPPLLRAINWKMFVPYPNSPTGSRLIVWVCRYMIFGTFNGLAFIHMFLTAPETKGIYTPPS